MKKRITVTDNTLKEPKTYVKEINERNYAEFEMKKTFTPKTYKSKKGKGSYTRKEKYRARYEDYE